MTISAFQLFLFDLEYLGFFFSFFGSICWLNDLCLAAQIELEDPLENVGVKLVRQAGAKTNELAGDGCTTSIVLAQGIIAEGMKVLLCVKKNF